MPVCARIPRKHRHICIGDMRDRIDITIRSLQAPIDGSVDFSESLTAVETVWAMLETKAGVEIFDGTNLKGVATHFFHIRFRAGIDINNWITFKAQNYTIIDVQNFEERNEFLLLRCALLGDETKATNFTR